MFNRPILMADYNAPPPNVGFIKKISLSMCTENQIVSCKSESDLLYKFLKISQQRLLHYTYNYHCLLFLWFLLFSIFFELKKGTHGRLLFGTLCIGNYLHTIVEKRYCDTAGTIFKYCLYYL